MITRSFAALCGTALGVAMVLGATDSRAQDLHIGTLAPNGLAIDPTATVGQNPTVPCQTSSGPTLPASVCASFNVPYGMQYLGWISKFGNTAVAAEAEMTPGAGSTNGMWVHTVQGNSGQGMFASEFDVFNATPASDTHQRYGVVVVGVGATSNAAVNVTKNDKTNDQWVTGVSVGTSASGPGFFDMTNDANVVHVAGGVHSNMLVPSPTAAFPFGLFAAQSDAPAGSIEDVVWRQTSGASNSGNWTIGPVDQAGVRCGLCISTPLANSGAAAGTNDIVLGPDGSFATAGTLARASAAGSARHLAMSAAATSAASVTLAPTFTDAPDVLGSGMAALTGTLTCANASGAAATWRTTLIWSVPTGTVQSSAITLVVASQNGQTPSGTASPTFWTPSFGTGARAVPTLSVGLPNGAGAVSCKADQEMLVNHAT